MAYMKMGDLLVSVGLITQEQLAEALRVGKETHKRLGEVLLSSGVITEQQMIEALEMQLGITFIDLSRIQIPTELARLVPKSLAKKHSVVPVKLVKDELILAMADPLNFMAIEDVRSATRKRITPRIATAVAVDRAIASLYGDEGAVRALEEMAAAERPDQAQTNASATHDLDAEGGQSAPTVRLVNSILEQAVTVRASDIHLEPQEEEMLVRMRVDGLLRSGITIPRDLQEQVISRLKIMGGMDIAEHRIPQDGRVAVRVRGNDVDLRVSTLPTIHGEKVVIRLLDRSLKLHKPEDLGLSGDNLKKYHTLLENASGMVLIVGPTGSGKSSTMQTMIRILNTPESNVVTLEDPVEYHIDRVNQVQINEKTGMTFASGLRSILRQDPDVIAVGEVRDGETAEIAMRSAITGHLVLSTIHANDTLAGINRLLDMGVEPYLIGDALKGMISQRLVRRLCPQCREEVMADEDELRWLGLPPGTQQKIYHAKGCPHCYHTGYQGRMGIFEVLVLSRKAKMMISEGHSKAELMEQLQKEDFTTLRENCIKLVLEGVTTIDEGVRTVNSTEEVPNASA